jgi:hypothetical protein
MIDEERHQVLSGIHPILVGDLLAGLERPVGAAR